ncbi:hypothetical protein L1987_73063 [Smallanthus sonchifolius]|uniref:Uncharacterized protein n=1 Tax=Smallanthus sonchifolius TaxID=185202 RepID=A0ACB8ZZT3_9ASTR|nr:hypothetical protein L1987_73063 [Smallanthus sonchifolius]
MLWVTVRGDRWRRGRMRGMVLVFLSLIRVGGALVISNIFQGSSIMIVRSNEILMQVTHLSLDNRITTSTGGGSLGIYIILLPYAFGYTGLPVMHQLLTLNFDFQTSVFPCDSGKPFSVIIRGL